MLEAECMDSWSRVSPNCSTYVRTIIGAFSRKDWNDNRWKSVDIKWGAVR